MNTRIIIFMFCLPWASRTNAQQITPSVQELGFEVVAQKYNTFNDKREPMTFLTGFTIEGDASLLKKNPVQVLFNPIAKMDRGDCLLMRWDPVMRVWNKLTGNQLKNAFEGRNVYWAATIDSPGHFALMKEIPKTGKTQLVLPKGYSTEEWRYVQSNLGVVCEGFTPSATLMVPLINLSPAGNLSLKIRKNAGSIENLADQVLGTLVTDFWKDPNALNQTFELSLASLK